MNPNERRHTEDHPKYGIHVFRGQIQIQEEPVTQNGSICLNDNKDSSSPFHSTDTVPGTVRGFNSESSQKLLIRSALLFPLHFRDNGHHIKDSTKDSCEITLPASGSTVIKPKFEIRTRMRAFTNNDFPDYNSKNFYCKKEKKQLCGA